MLTRRLRKVNREISQCYVKIKLHNKLTIQWHTVLNMFVERWRKKKNVKSLTKGLNHSIFSSLSHFSFHLQTRASLHHSHHLYCSELWLIVIRLWSEKIKKLSKACKSSTGMEHKIKTVHNHRKIQLKVLSPF